MNILINTFFKNINNYLKWAEDAGCCLDMVKQSLYILQTYASDLWKLMVLLKIDSISPWILAKHLREVTRSTYPWHNGHSENTHAQLKWIAWNTYLRHQLWFRNLLSFTLPWEKLPELQSSVRTVLFLWSGVPARLVSKGSSQDSKHMPKQKILLCPEQKKLSGIMCIQHIHI